jgi:hypothetical protein
MDNRGKSHRSEVTKGISINSKKRNDQRKENFKENKKCKKIDFFQRNHLKKMKLHVPTTLLLA